MARLYHWPICALVGRFLKDALRSSPLHAVWVPLWDLIVILEASCSPPFEPLHCSDLRRLSCNTAFFLTITYAKRVRELHAWSVADKCLRSSLGGLWLTLWPNPSLMPKSVAAFHVNEPLPHSQRRGCLPTNATSLYPMRALKQYIAVSSSFHVRLGAQGRPSSV